MKVLCRKCNRERTGIEPVCPSCGVPYSITPDFKFRSDVWSNFPYAQDPITLGEVITPLVERDEVAFKLDYYQPTYSYKDRGAKTLLSFLRDHKDAVGPRIAEDSSGNAGASITAYGRRAGFDVDIFVPASARGVKLELIKQLGGNLTRVEGSREDVRRAAMDSRSYYAGHSIYPEFRDGIRSLSYELFDQYGGSAPDAIYIPTSAGTLLSGIYLGFKHLFESGEIDKMPHLVACQPELMSPIEARLKGSVFTLGDKRSVADALVTVEPPLMDELLEIVRGTGSAVTVSEAEIIEARNALSLAGIYTEYSSAVAYAAYRNSKKGSRCTVVLTGNGLKTPF